MRAFSCPVCSRLVTFESDRCLHCGAEIAFDPAVRGLVALRRTPARDPDEVEPTESALLGAPEPTPEEIAAADQVRCANATLIGCNWLAERAEPDTFCRSCALTRTRPADVDEEGLEQFAGAERHKRRLHFELLELGLPIADGQRRDGGLIFDLLSSTAGPVTTGHADGVITMDLAEQDDVHREQMRDQLNEPYRTVLGHLRHEVGHYYWTVLVADAGDEARLTEARELFGDDREDYGEALDRHYKDGAPDDWSDEHVSSYATMHPMEDWAETWAHYLHLWDAVQTAASYRVSVAGPAHVTDPTGTFAGRVADPVVGRFPEALEQWLPLSYALNALSRSLGNEDLYPFVLAPPVVEKLAFIDRAVAAGAARDAGSD
ncbi:zinc-binding metallopeptidase family protein [Patulibacter minatonensis]|uniref:zinc-binding metallopeptidase family protein n=1 Tax=Patulibacter minatonensis TaxID=298163 RepID=UPI00047B88AB|nr:putative zinc-binding metallopeptidase [Patulibacter minatonensis]